MSSSSRSDRSCNKSGGADMEKVDKLRKKATTAKGRHHQKKGSASSGAKAQYAKAQRNPSKDMEF